MKTSQFYQGEGPALAQAGGGLWGIAHIGVLRYLQEQEIPLRAIAGVSMGALVGGVASTFVRKDGTLDAAGIEYLQKIAGKIRKMDDIVVKENGRTRLAIHELLKSASPMEYQWMMKRGPTIPFMAQMACKFPDGTKQKEIFGYASPGTEMETVLTMAEVSSANKHMFGIDPIKRGDVEFSDDISVARLSIGACTREVRERFEGITVIGTVLAFKDSFGPVANILDYMNPEYADCGDVVIKPKEGRQMQNGGRLLSNWRMGWPLPFLGKSFARNQTDLDAGKCIAIPTQEFIDAGYTAAQKQGAQLAELR